MCVQRGRVIGSLSEWLRRKIRNLLGSARAGSNPAAVAINFFISPQVVAHRCSVSIFFFFGRFFFSVCDVRDGPFSKFRSLHRGLSSNNQSHIFAMELAIHQDDAQVLLVERNKLHEPEIEKYRVAGQISQTCLQYLIELVRDSYHLGKTPQPYTCQELCILGDSYLKTALDNVYKNGAVRERGIAMPVTIELNDIVSGFAPELDDSANYVFSAGDIVTFTLGAQIDGYTANVAHTIVVYPPGDAKPVGPLLGAKADSICASHIATETVVSMLGTVLSPEKLPQSLVNVCNNGNQVNGELIRKVVDSIAKSYNCVVVPGLKVRRVRRFLAGQAEGIVAERDFKGVVWSESDQETALLSRSSHSQDLIVSDSAKSTGLKAAGNGAVPTDDFYITAGEVYNIDIKMAPLSDFEEVGVVTLETIDEFTGANHKKDAFNTKPTIYIRDVIIKHALKLKTSRHLLGQIDKQSVFPFKLSHMSNSFPLNIKETDQRALQVQIESITKEVKSNRLGLAELNNRHLVKPKPIQVARFVPLELILVANNESGSMGVDLDRPLLPGMELSLPKLGISLLKLKALLKKSKPVAVSRESTTVVLIEDGVIPHGRAEVLRLTGGSKNFTPSWVHSNYNLNGCAYAQAITDLDSLVKDKKFGIKVRECQPFKMAEKESMQLD